MAPRVGSIHRVARRDSKAALMWEWADTQRTPWTTRDLVEHIGGTPRRVRAIVAAWLAGGLIREIKPAMQEARTAGGRTGIRQKRQARRTSSYELAFEHRGKPAPVLIVERGRIKGLRMPELIEPARVAAIRERTGLTLDAMADRLGIHYRTLTRILAGEISIATDDPIIAQLNVLDAIAGGEAGWSHALHKPR